jgi:hypothetical protein
MEVYQPVDIMYNSLFFLKKYVFLGELFILQSVTLSHLKQGMIGQLSRAFDKFLDE